MRIAVIGTGYVGLVAGTCFAETGNDVVCVDIDGNRIKSLQAGSVPIYEPGLGEMIQRNQTDGRLSFTSDLKAGILGSDILFIAVGTPSGEDGAPQVEGVFEVARAIGRHMDAYRLIVVKSTVPVGTGDRIQEEISLLTKFEFDVASNPEFLKEGAALGDFLRPDRVIIGVSQHRVGELLTDLYAPFLRTGSPILIMDRRSAEMTKYSANAVLASRISLMNEIANLCELVGADVSHVRQGLGSDGRIGSSFLFPGVGYGGSCFSKDIRALLYLSRVHHYSPHLLQAIEVVNERQKRKLVEKILSFFSQEILAENATQAHCPLKGLTFAIWGLAFKPQTDDVREAPSLVIIRELLELGARVHAYDPKAIGSMRQIFGNKIQYAQDNYEVLRGADALVLVTEWNLFRNPDFSRIKRLLRRPIIFDGRNQYNPTEIRELGFTYFGIGRS